MTSHQEDLRRLPEHLTQRISVLIGFTLLASVVLGQQPTQETPIAELRDLSDLINRLENESAFASDDPYLEALRSLVMKSNRLLEDGEGHERVITAVREDLLRLIEQADASSGTHSSARNAIIRDIHMSVLKEPPAPPNYEKVRKTQGQAGCDTGFTNEYRSFKLMEDKCGDNRIGVVAVGDSWFSFPGSSIMYELRRAIYWADQGPTVNLLSVAQTGADAPTVSSASQKLDLGRSLQYREGTDFLLISAGANDLVGEVDIDRLLLGPTDAIDASKPEDYVDEGVLSFKLARIKRAYKEILHIRDTYAPSSIIVTHTYDRVQPADRKAKVRIVFFGIPVAGPWIHPFMIAKGILDPQVQRSISDYLLRRLNRTIKDSLPPDTGSGRKAIIVDTFGSLKPGDPVHWQDEIHPTRKGFERLTTMIIACMQLHDRRFLPDYGKTYGTATKVKFVNRSGSPTRCVRGSATN